MPTIVVQPHPDYCPDGVQFVAQPGSSLCDALLERGVELDHACGKVGACTTCHIIVAQGAASLNPVSDAEDDMLDRAWGVAPGSRLACQAAVADTPLEVAIPRYSINHAKENLP